MTINNLERLQNELELLNSDIAIIQTNLEKTKNKTTDSLTVLGILVNKYWVYKGIRGTSINEKVISFHLIEDVLGLVSIFIVGVINLFFNLPILDSIL